MMGARTWTRTTMAVAWSPTVIVTVGMVDGLPAIPWGAADPTLLATARQLRHQGLRPAGADPVAVLHRQAGRRRIEYANLYLIGQAKPRRRATPQLAAIEKALAARRTCQLCGREQDYYLSTLSRLCVPCEDVTGFWPTRAAEHGWGWAA